MVSAIEAACALVPGLAREDAERLRLELIGDHEFYDRLSRAMFAGRNTRFETRRWNELVYVLIRATQPDTMLETGIFDGRATVVALRAMQRNGKGHLISIDLPAVAAIPDSTTGMLHSTLPKGMQPGWLISDDLRERHSLYLGDSAEVLPQVLAVLDSIDIFQHDSLHTYGHMMMEFAYVCPKIRFGGLLLSDDVNWNRAFYEQAHGKPYVICDGFGGMLV